jgi:hypothetical protein
MPTQFVVADTSNPIYKTAGGDVDYLAGSTEEANFRELRAVIMQCGNLANYATSVFQDLYNDIINTGERVAVLDKRLATNVFGIAGAPPLAYIEHQFVVQEEPMVFYENAPGRAEEVKSKWHQRGTDLFTDETMPHGLAEQCKQLRADMDFSPVDQLTAGFGDEGFRSSKRGFSNPGTFKEQWIEALLEQVRSAHLTRRRKLIGCHLFSKSG